MSVAESALQQQMHVLYSSHHGWLRKKLGGTHSAADVAREAFLLHYLDGQTQAVVAETMSAARRADLTQIGFVIQPGSAPR